MAAVLQRAPRPSVDRAQSVGADAGAWCASANMETRPILARLQSDVEPRPPHDSLVAAFESAARDRAPFMTLHGARGPVVRPIRDALESAQRWRSALHGRGIRRGDRVPLLMP